MDYKEKVRIAEAAVLEIEGGKSLEEIKARLQNEGYQQEDIYAVSGSIRRQINQKYEEEINTLLAEGREAEIASKFANLPADDLADMVEKAKAQRIKSLVSKVKRMRADGSDSMAILTFLSGQHLSAEEITLVVDRAVNSQSAEEDSSGSSNIGSILLGIVLVIGGIVLSMNTDSIFYGAVVVGAIMVIKGLL